MWSRLATHDAVCGVAASLLRQWQEDDDASNWQRGWTAATIGRDVDTLQRSALYPDGKPAPGMGTCTMMHTDGHGTAFPYDLSEGETELDIRAAVEAAIRGHYIDIERRSKGGGGSAIQSPRLQHRLGMARSRTPQGQVVTTA